MPLKPMPAAVACRWYAAPEEVAPEIGEVADGGPEDEAVGRTYVDAPVPLGYAEVAFSKRTWGEYLILIVEELDEVSELEVLSVVVELSDDEVLDELVVSGGVTLEGFGAGGGGLGFGGLWFEPEPVSK